MPRKRKNVTFMDVFTDCASSSRYENDRYKINVSSFIKCLENNDLTREWISTQINRFGEETFRKMVEKCYGGSWGEIETGDGIIHPKSSLPMFDTNQFMYCLEGRKDEYRIESEESRKLLDKYIGICTKECTEKYSKRKVIYLGTLVKCVAECIGEKFCSEYSDVCSE